MMILSAADINKYIPLRTSSTDIGTLEGFENRALFKHFPRYIGNILVDELAGTTPDAALLTKVKPVLANLAYLEAVPFLDVVSTSTGFGVVRNNNVAPASTERVRALKEGCLQAANDFMDNLLYFLEQSQQTYTSWNKSSLNQGSLIPDTDTFNIQTKLNLRRYQFIQLKTHLQITEYLHLKDRLSPEFLSELQAGSDIVVKPLVQKALAFIAYQGYVNDNHPQYEIGITPEPWKLKGFKYLENALSYLKNHLVSYSTYSTYGYEAPYDNNNDDNVESGLFIAGITG